jgi:hypothetical protein
MLGALGSSKGGYLATVRTSLKVAMWKRNQNPRSIPFITLQILTSCCHSKLKITNRRQAYGKDAGACPVYCYLSIPERLKPIR